jgi:hypothetical protein
MITARPPIVGTTNPAEVYIWREVPGKIAPPGDRRNATGPLTCGNRERRLPGRLDAELLERCYARPIGTSTPRALSRVRLRRKARPDAERFMPGSRVN